MGTGGRRPELVAYELTALADKLDTLNISHEIIDWAGLKFRILFAEYGYTPHFASHIKDPVDDREKLVLAIPHTSNEKRHSVIIYDLKSKQIEQEIFLPFGGMYGTHHNPHVAHVLTTDPLRDPIAGGWTDEQLKSLNAAEGDIICPANDNTWVVIDRDTGNIIHKIVPSNPDWVHDILPSRDGQNFIATCWGENGWFRKIKADGTTVWNVDQVNSAKASIIEPVQGTHTSSYGGDYIIACNTDNGPILEIRDDGSEAWRCDGRSGNINQLWGQRPHSAFRMGISEGQDLTVIGYEGGGFLAVDENCRPVWGVYSVLNSNIGPNSGFAPPTRLLSQVTHVFPTLHGTIGFVSFYGKYMSVVGEVLGMPYHQKHCFVLAQDIHPPDDWQYYDPPIRILDWDYVSIDFVNLGSNSLDYEVFATKTPHLCSWDFPDLWKSIASGSVAGGDIATVEIDNRSRLYSAIRVRGKRTTSGQDSSSKIFVSYGR